MSIIDFSEIRDALLIGFLLSITLGPVFFMLIKTSIAKGFKAAVSFDLGVIFSDMVLISLAYLGSKNLLEHLKNDSKIFFIGGAALLIYGLCTYFAKDKVAQKQPNGMNYKRGYVGLFLKGFLLNFINIGVLIFWIGTMVVVGPRLDMNPYKIVSFFAIVFGFYFCIDLGKIILAKKLSKKMTPQNIIKIRKYTGVGLVIFGIVLFIRGAFIVFENF